MFSFDVSRNLKGGKTLTLLIRPYYGLKDTPFRKNYCQHHSTRRTFLPII